jgi:hypothetical protein
MSGGMAKFDVDSTILVTPITSRTEEFLGHFASEYKFNIAKNLKTAFPGGGKVLTVVDAATLTKDAIESLRQVSGKRDFKRHL